VAGGGGTTFLPAEPSSHACLMTTSTFLFSSVIFRCVKRLHALHFFIAVQKLRAKFLHMARAFASRPTVFSTMLAIS
jgi:hypothetical protein